MSRFQENYHPHKAHNKAHKIDLFKQDKAALPEQGLAGIKQLHKSQDLAVSSWGASMSIPILAARPWISLILVHIMENWRKTVLIMGTKRKKASHASRSISPWRSSMQPQITANTMPMASVNMVYAATVPLMYSYCTFAL